MDKYALNYIYLSKHHAGGKDQFALNLLQGIYQNGMYRDYIVFCYDYSEDIIKKIAPDIEVVTIKSHFNNKGSQSELSRLAHITYDNTFVIPKLIEKYQVKLIFHASCTNGIRAYKVPSVVIPHDIKAVSHRVMGKVKISFYKYILYKIMYGMDFRHADRIVAISETDKSEMQNCYKKYKDKVTQIYNPIKVKDYEGIKREDVDSSTGNIVAINLQFHHKNILTLIKAFEQIKDEINNNLVLVGNVPDRVKYLKDYVEEHNLTDRVIFTGFIDGDKKRKLLTQCALYVNPSLFEGFGMTAVEAMILKVPTLLSKVSANYEVTEGMCSYYEPADSVEALKNAIITCLENPCSSEELDNKSRKMYEAYNYQKIAGQYTHLFQEMCEGIN